MAAMLCTYELCGATSGNPEQLGYIMTNTYKLAATKMAWWHAHLGSNMNNSEQRGAARGSAGQHGALGSHSEP